MKKYLALTAVLVLMSCGKDVDIIQEILSPLPASIVFPENNSLCTTGLVISDTESEVIFGWEPSGNADSYEVTLINLENDDVQVLSTDANELSIQLLRSTPYSWFVTSILASNDNTTDSDTASFYNAGPGLASHVPFPATAISPQNNGQLQSTPTIVLQWQGNDLDDDIINYDIFFGENNSPGLFSEELTSNSLENIAVAPGTQYFWRVLTRDSLGNESSSAIFTFGVSN